MASIEEVVEMWDKIHPNRATETQKGIHVLKDTNGKIKRVLVNKRTCKEAVIKLLKFYPFSYEPWNERTCYVLRQTEDSKSMYFGFERRTKECFDTQKIYDFLNENFKGQKIINIEMILSKEKTNPNHLTLIIKLDNEHSAEKICEYIKAFIEKLKMPLFDFFVTKSKEEIVATIIEPAIEPDKKYDDDIFDKILEKHKIDKEINKELHDKCNDIYKDVIKIYEKLLISSEGLLVSHYTKKNVANNLLVLSEYNKFRLYYTLGMNDPTEGNTLLSYLEVEKEKSLELFEYLPFVASFSLNIDNLNQFRLYGKEKDEEATGVSVVFHPSFFADKKYRLCRCVYVDPDKKKVKSISSRENEKNKVLLAEIESFFDELNVNIFNLLKLDLSKFNINKAELIRDLLMKIRYIVKDYAFAEEQECRITDMRSKKDEFIEIDEVNKNRLYIDSMFITDYVPEIYFGPLAEGMEAFEIKTGIKCIRSRHPYKSTR